MTSILPLAAAPDQPSAYAGKPQSGKPQELPGIIQAESYDVAPANANGIAYNRKGPAQVGAARSAGDCIGLGTVGSDHVSIKGDKEKEGQIYVGWTEIGDWWNYTVQVKQAGTYYFGGKFAAGEKGAQIIATFTPVAKSGKEATTGPLEIPTTAGYQPAVEVYHVWETLDKLGEVTLTPGTYILTVKIEHKAGVNIDYYSFTRK
ncbi:MAG: carbohydrate-binding domain-containing protein [Verrucomicrobiota bacterium]